MCLPYLQLFVSRRNRPSWLFLALLLALVMLPMAGSLAWPSPAGPTLVPDFGKLPLSFVPNIGQTDPTVHFQVWGMGGTLFFTPGEVVLVCRR